jgi:hypothetical protein
VIVRLTSASPGALSGAFALAREVGAGGVSGGRAVSAEVADVSFRLPAGAEPLLLSFVALSPTMSPARRRSPATPAAAGSQERLRLAAGSDPPSCQPASDVWSALTEIGADGGVGVA